MCKSINRRLTITYGLLFLLAISFIDVTLITLYVRQQYLKTEKVYSEMAGIVSDMAERNLKITYFLNSPGAADRNRLDGRVLVLNLSKNVIADSARQFEGQVIDNPEIRKTFTTKRVSVGYYKIEAQRMAMLSYPMFKNNIFTGAVLVSYDMSGVWNDILLFAFRVVLISIAVILLVLIITYYLSRKFVKPIKKMTAASLEILHGRTGVTVEVIEKDEIGTLARTFNKMSSELGRIEEGRKRFVSSVSHEFKTPLTSIKALIEPFMGEDDVDTGILNEHLKYVDMEIDRLSKLVKSLVTVTRLEEINPSISQMNLLDETSSIIRILTPIASDKGIKIINSISENLIIEADRDLYREVLINIVDNAIKYGKEGGWVKLVSEKSHAGITLVISDNGRGINEKELPYIFDNFYMTDDARESGKGSGIGLYVVKRITEISGWDIKVKSTPFEGTEFTIIM